MIQVLSQILIRGLQLMVVYLSRGVGSGHVSRIMDLDSSLSVYLPLNYGLVRRDVQEARDCV